MSLKALIKNQWKRVFPSQQAKIFSRWKKDGGEKRRYEYHLSEDSCVVDVGGYKGEWAFEIWKKYRPTIHIFEPVKEYAHGIESLFSPLENKVHVYAIGLSDKDKTLDISILENESSLFRNSGGQTQKATFAKASDFLHKQRIEHVDVMKINIEGGEYDLLEELIESGYIKNIKNIQVQFHNFVPHAREKMENIQMLLSKTHHLTFQYRFVWENWERNNQ